MGLENQVGEKYRNYCINFSLHSALGASDMTRGATQQKCVEIKFYEK
jgi:hypothetical protein